MYIAGTLIDLNCYYRIQNNFEGSNDNFWYNISTDKDQLHSFCQAKENAPVYKGSELSEVADVIRRNTNVKIIKV